MTQQQKQYYASLHHVDGLTWQQVAYRINEDLGLNLTRDQARDRLKRVVVNVEGQEERKPKIEHTDTGYRIRYGNYDSFLVEEEQVRRAFSLFCLGGLTMNQTALEMGWTRKEFYALKTAFSVTKDDLPFTPRQLEEQSVEELGEYARQEKKRYALQVYEKNKYADIKSRIKQYDMADYWFGRIIKESNKIDFKPIVRYEKPIHECFYKVNITDVHAGLEVENYFNNYNRVQMKHRFDLVYNALLDEIPIGSRVHISDIGDTLHGIIHGSVKKYGEWMVEATFNVMQDYVNLLANLSEYYELSFSKVNGSHESLEKGKTDRTEEENMGNLIYNVIKWKLDGVKYIDKLLGYPCTIIPVFNYHIMDTHGDATSMKNLAEASMIFKDYNIIQVDCGHIHHDKREEISGVKVVYNEPFCGTDQYASGKFMHSEPGVRVCKYDERGKIAEFLIRLGER